MFTTRPTRSSGRPSWSWRPEHPLVDKLTTPDRRAEVDAYLEQARRQTEIERLSTDRREDRRPARRYAINPVNGERVPIWIADYVLAGYGTGAIMAVPAHDERDFAFARQFDLPIRRGRPPGDAPADADRSEAAYVAHGADEHDGQLGPVRRPARPTRAAERSPTGSSSRARPSRRSTTACATGWSPASATGARRSRSSTATNDGIVPVPETELPVLLPEDVEFQGTGESPLTTHQAFVNVTCPRCGGPARRETDTMDTFMDSSWYFLRYLSPHNDDGAVRSPRWSTTGYRSTSTRAAPSTR